MATGTARLLKQVMAPVARVRTGDALGSATIIKSDDVGTYLLTNHHVVESCIQYKDVWDELVEREVKKEFRTTVEVDMPRVSPSGRVAGLTTIVADIVIANKEQDLALLRLRDSEAYPEAKLYPEADASDIPMLVELACCGAAMGEKPIVTTGLLNGTQIEILNYEYWMSSAQSIYGNSGGAVFTPHKKTWAYVGIPSRITVNIMGYSADAITHMGYFIPIFRIYKWLRDNCYEYLWDPKADKATCDERRREKRARQLAIAVSKQK